MRRCGKHHRQGYGECPGCQRDAEVKRVHDMLVQGLVRYVLHSGVPLTDYFAYQFDSGID